MRVTLHFVPFHFVPGHFVPVTLSPGHLVPGHFVPGHFVPWSLCPPVTLSPVTLSPGHFVPWSLCPRSLCPQSLCAPIFDFWNDMMCRSIYFKTISEHLRLVYRVRHKLWCTHVFHPFSGIHYPILLILAPYNSWLILPQHITFSAKTVNTPLYRTRSNFENKLWVRALLS
jgi:hypothetical protein